MKTYEYKIVLTESKLKKIVSKVYDELTWPYTEKDCKKHLSSYLSKKAFVEIFLEEKHLKQVLDEEFEFKVKEIVNTLYFVLSHDSSFKSLDTVADQRDMITKAIRDDEYEESKVEREAHLIRSVEALGYIVTKKNGDQNVR